MEKRLSEYPDKAVGPGHITVNEFSLDISKFVRDTVYTLMNSHRFLHNFISCHFDSTVSKAN